MHFCSRCPASGGAEEELPQGAGLHQDPQPRGVPSPPPDPSHLLVWLQKPPAAPAPDSPWGSQSTTSGESGAGGGSGDGAPHPRGQEALLPRGPEPSGTEGNEALSSDVLLGDSVSVHIL